MPVLEDKSKTKFDKADAQVTALAADARKAQYEADTLALARDVAQIGQLHRQVLKTESAARTELVLHLRSQNTIGASLISDWMMNNMAVQSGLAKEMVSALDRVWVLLKLMCPFIIPPMFCLADTRTTNFFKSEEQWTASYSILSAYRSFGFTSCCVPLQFTMRFPENPTIVWCDMMKCGRVSLGEMDEICVLLSHVLHKKPDKAVALVIAPYLVAEKLKNPRDQLRLGNFITLLWLFVLSSLFPSHCFNLSGAFPLCRKWEDKMDAKSLVNESISIRCLPPPSRRKVPIQFAGWVVLWPDLQQVVKCLHQVNIWL